MKECISVIFKPPSNLLQWPPNTNNQNDHHLVFTFFTIRTASEKQTKPRAEEMAQWLKKCWLLLQRTQVQSQHTWNNLYFLKFQIQGTQHLLLTSTDTHTNMHILTQTQTDTHLYGICALVQTHKINLKRKKTFNCFEFPKMTCSNDDH